MMSIMRQKHALLALLLITLLVTTFLHLWRLADFPPSVSGDEAYNGLEVLLLMAEPELIVFAPSNAGREALFHYILMFSTIVFGPTLYSLRIWPALVGILIVALSYRWVRALLPPSSQTAWIALLTAIFVATSLWELQLSRLGLRGILVVPCMLAAYYFFWCGYCRQQYRWFILSGLSLGLATHTYPASRSLPLIFILFVAFLSLFYRKQEAGRLWLAWRGLFITGFVSMVVFAPLGWYFFNHPGALLFRSGQVSLWASYQAHHAHTGESFAHYVLVTWGENLRWFIDLSTPWGQNKELPSILRLAPFFFWVGLIRAIYLARWHVGYTFLLISFFVGILPIFLGLATTMRVILALPATYVLLAIGAYYPIEYLLNRARNLSLPVNSAVMAGVLLISTISSAGFFRFERWVGLPPLPTLVDYAFDISARRIRDLVLDERQSVMLPQAVYGFPPAQFLLQADFSLALPFEDKAVLDSAETISVYWPANWARWFENKPPSFVLLSPGIEGRTGYIEAVGQWEQTKIVDFENIVQAQKSLPETEVVVDRTGRPLGYVIKIDRDQVINSLRTVPQNPVQLNFQDEIFLLGYDAWFLSERNLDIGLFFRAQRNILEDHQLLLQLVDRQGRVWGERSGPFLGPVSTWYPGQLVIDHQIIKLTDGLPPGVYVLKVGLIKTNYKEPVLSTWGEWMSASNLARVSLPEPVFPIGLIQVGEPPNFDHDLNVNFDDQISLTGYHLDQGISSDTFQISLRWQPLQPIDKDYTITIQLLDQNRQLVAQIDKPPLGGAYPMTAWLPGMQIPDSYDLQLPETVPSGVYQLAVGIYDPQTLQRLPISQTDNAIPGANLVVMQQVVLN